MNNGNLNYTEKCNWCGLYSTWQSPHIERDESNDIPLELTTLRDQFAMASLNKLISDNDVLRPDVIAKLAYTIADQMLEARK
jgi:hypothetical protein